jgi:transcription elongation GreA/GreB family factor
LQQVLFVAASRKGARNPMEHAKVLPDPGLKAILAHARSLSEALDGSERSVLTGAAQGRDGQFIQPYQRRSPNRLAGAVSRPNLILMSSAFIREDDDAVEELPDRPISTAPNLVTPEGLAAIEAEVARLSEELAQAGDDREARARIGRDLRYWTARRASAQVVAPPDDASAVRFGSTVTVARDDGRSQVFRIVGEDEADPEKGTLSHVSPLARALMGKNVGDSVSVAGHDVEIVKIG